MLDSVLIVRTIHAVDNYDYIVDVTFHQNGAMGASVTLTGYISGHVWTDDESPYGFQFHDYLYGPMHQHLAHFKVCIVLSKSTDSDQFTVDFFQDKNTCESLIHHHFCTVTHDMMFVF